MSIVFETGFGNDPKNVKMTGDVRTPYAGSEILENDGITNKFLYQSGGDEDPHLMMIADPVGFSENGSVAMISGGRRNHTSMQGWFGTQGLSEQRMYLNADHHLFPSGWVYMIEEWKVKPNVEGSSFRIPVRLIKDADGNWGWFIHAVTASNDTIDEEYFAFTNWDAPVPIEIGFRKASFFRVGDPGKIMILIKPDGGEWIVVFDLDVRTDSPHVDEVRSCQEWYTQMMYPSAPKSAAIAELGGVPQQYYDWWRLSIPGYEPGTSADPEPTPEPIPEGENMLTYEWSDDDKVYIVKWNDAEVTRSTSEFDLRDTLNKYLADLKESDVAEQIRQFEEAIAEI